MYTIYSKTGCPYCDKIEKIFGIAGLEYKKYMLDKNFTKSEFVELFGERSTFPRVLDPDGNVIGGATETAIYLKSNGLV